MVFSFILMFTDNYVPFCLMILGIISVLAES